MMNFDADFSSLTNTFSSNLRLFLYSFELPKLMIVADIAIDGHCVNIVAGNLALSRALGDFVFKRNNMKLPEEQIVTGFSFLLYHCLRKVHCMLFCSITKVPHLLSFTYYGITYNEMLIVT